MTDRPLLVVSLEGFAPAALGCYGSSWNETPSIDRVASRGAVWDRCIATSEDPLAVLGSWLSPPASPGETHWLESFRRLGPVELITDDLRVIEQGLGEAFDQAVLVEETGDEPMGGPVETGEIGATALGRLVATALERHRRAEGWSLLWLHSRFLTDRWDAPRSLVPLDTFEEELAEEEPLEDWQDPETASTGRDPEAPPPIFLQQVPPKLWLDEDSHPDLVTAWMRTYACQIRLVDWLLELLLEELRVRDPIPAILGTSGFSLGQNGWIGDRGGPLQSCRLRLPVILGAGSPIRSSRLEPSSRVADWLSIAGAGGLPITPESWAARDEEFEPAVITTADDSSDRLAVTTHNWFYVRETLEERLYLKPDDIDDVNDVSRLSREAMDTLASIAEREGL